MLTCPRCRLANPDSALRCDCGYSFETKQLDPRYAMEKTEIPEWIKVVCIFLLPIGIIIFLSYLARKKTGQAKTTARWLGYGLVANILLRALWEWMRAAR